MALVISAASRTVRVSGPTVSSVPDSANTPERPISPAVGFNPTSPQAAAGNRIEPPVSDPSAAGTAPAATAAPEPDDDPPVTWAGFHGFRTGPVWAFRPSPPNAASTV